MYKTKKRISVAMATYNGEKYIEAQMKSILDNLGVEDEVIVSDDGSQDNTLKIIESMRDKRITIISGPQKGIMKNFENAISHTKGRYIFLADQDDIWERNKVETILSVFKRDNVKVVVHDVEIIDAYGEIIANSFFKYRKSKEGVLNNIVKNSFLGCTMSFTSDMKDIILPIPSTRYVKDQWHDQWIGLLCNYYGKAIFLSEKLGKYRRHGNNNSSLKRSSIMVMIRNRIVITYLVLNRIIRK